MSKSIPGFPGYKITSGGKITGPNGDALSPRKDKDGYMRVDLRLDGKRFTRFVHSLVERTFGGSGKEVDHKDGDRTNNTKGNLETVSHKENMKRMGARQKKK